MSNISGQLHALVLTTQGNLHYLLMLIGTVWLVHFMNVGCQYRLNALGIYPRRLPNLIGIFTCPFLHGNFSHLFFNSIPLFLLANFILLNGHLYFLAVSISIIGLGGLAVWLMGREALHVGASGLIMGYWGFLIINAVQHPDVTTIFLIAICFYYFGGFVTSLIPLEEKSSWESHIFGLLAGIATNYYQLYEYPMRFLVGN